MNNMNSQASKMSKSQVIQLLDQKIDDLLNLSDSMKTVPSIIPFTPMLIWAGINRVSMRNKPSEFYNLFIEIIEIIFAISIDDGINFIADATEISSEDPSFKSLKLIVFKISNCSQVEKSLYDDSCRDLLKEIAIKFLFGGRDTLNLLTEAELNSLGISRVKSKIRRFAYKLTIYRRKISQKWKDDPKLEYAFQIDHIGEFRMQGDKSISYSIGDITNSNLSGIVQGEHNTVIASLNAAGQPELAQALTKLTQAVLASHDLPEDKKEEQVKVITQIGKEAAESKPNKTLLKILVDGLLATLKAVPDVAGAVTAVMPLLSQLHL